MFDAPSWEPWRAFLAALQALPMSAEQLALLPASHGPQSSRQRSPRAMPSWLSAGAAASRRILALIATYLACVLDHSDHIVPR